MRKKCRFAGLFLAGFSIFALVGCGNNEEPIIDPIENEFTVTFNTNGGSTVVSQTIEKGEKALEPTAPTKDGYKFGGWYVDETFKTEFDFDTTITENTTLYANWETYTVAELIEMSADYVDQESTERFYTYVTIKEVSNPQYGEMTVYDETGEILVYGTRGSDGNTYYENLEDKPYAGDEILLYANLVTFNGTPEIKQGWIVEVHHNEAEFDVNDYVEKSISDARKEEKGAKVIVEGVVAQFTYNASQNATGFILIDDSSSIYVYDDQISQQVEKGNTVKIAAIRDNWILTDEVASAEQWGYSGCIQLTDAHLLSNDGKESAWDKAWVKESTVKELMDVNPKDKNITTEIYKVNALVKEKPGKGFTNFYFFDLDGVTGSYTYSQANGKDFEWLREFDGKICTVYLMVLNYKSANSGINARFLPIEVKDDGFVFDQNDGAQFALDYYVKDLLKQDVYYADPNLEVPTSVSNDLINLKDVQITYTSSDETVIKFNVKDNKTYMNVLDFKNKEVIVTAEAKYNGVTAKFEKTIKTQEFNPADYHDVKGAIDTQKESEVKVTGIVGPSLVNRDGFYLIDDTGVLAVLTTKETLSTLNLGDEVFLHGTRTQFGTKENKPENPGQSCLINAVIDGNRFGNNAYSTKTFTSDKTFDELRELDYKTDLTTEVYYIKAKAKIIENKYSSKVQLHNPDNDEEYISLYCSGKNQYSFMLDYVGQELTYAVAPCNWNTKDYYAFCALNVQLEDGTIINNTLNFDNN